MLSPSPLISTKFYLPVARPDLIQRQELFDLLEKSMRLPFTLVSAPPGFGKTMLVASWLHTRVENSGVKICWLSLDEGDNLAPSFWLYVIAALQNADPRLGETARLMLGAPDSPGIEACLATLINDIAVSDDELLLVIDDYHHVQTHDVHNSLIFLLDHQPPNLHLVLLTREDPPLGLSRRRARRQMVEIRAANLRFRSPEIVEFLNSSMDLDLAPEQVDILERRTEGWIVGLQLAAVSLKSGNVQTFFESFTGDDRYIADYLIEEVLDRQTQEVRNFLLKTSILQKMCAPLCDSLLSIESGSSSSSQEMLERLESANLFIVPLDNRREWFRYHRLFTDLLQQRLRETGPAGEISRLHRLASQWYSEQIDVNAAIYHARKIPDEARVVDLVEQLGMLFFVRGELPQLAEIARNIPVRLRQESPLLCMEVAWAMLATNQQPEPWLEMIEQHFGLRAEAALDQPDLDMSIRAALLEVLIVRLQSPNDVFLHENHPKFLALKQSIDAYPPDQTCLLNTVANLRPVVSYDLGLVALQRDEMAVAAQAFEETMTAARELQNNYLLRLSLVNLANIHLAQGRLRDARQTSEQVLIENLGGIAPPAQAHAHAILGNLYYEWGEDRKAEEHFRAGLPLADAWNHWLSLIPITIGLARIAWRQGNAQRAFAILKEMKIPHDEQLLLPVALTRALWQAQQGNSSLAERWLEKSGLLAGEQITVHNEAIFLGVSHLLTHLSRLEDAHLLADKVMVAAEAAGRLHAVIQGCILKGVIYSMQGQVQDALQVLATALSLSAGQGYQTSFVDGGEPVRQLLEEIVHWPNAEQTVKESAAQILERTQKVVEDRHAPVMGQPELSEREREVLTLMADGLSNKDIAAQLFISITTVKTHIGNIFNKLGVSNRIQAVARGESLGLLPRR